MVVVGVERVLAQLLDREMRRGRLEEARHAVAAPLRRDDDEARLRRDGREHPSHVLGPLDADEDVARDDDGEGAHGVVHVARQSSAATVGVRGTESAFASMVFRRCGTTGAASVVVTSAPSAASARARSPLPPPSSSTRSFGRMARRVDVCWCRSNMRDSATAQSQTFVPVEAAVSAISSVLAAPGKA